jgi:hypothetical protein
MKYLVRVGYLDNPDNVGQIASTMRQFFDATVLEEVVLGSLETFDLIASIILEPRGRKVRKRDVLHMINYPLGQFSIAKYLREGDRVVEVYVEEAD